MTRTSTRLVGLACVTALTLLGGCSGKREEDGKTHLRFSGYVSSPAETELMKKLVADFNAAHPEIVVSYEPVPGQYYPKLLTMLVSRTAPDVFYLDILQFQPFLSKGVLRPLDDFLAASKTDRKDFLPSLMDAFTSQGQTYGIPKDFNTLGLFYNKAMFDAAKVPYPDPTWDLERMREAAKTLTRDGHYGIAIPHDSADRFVPFADMYGASLLKPDGKCGMDTPEAVDAINFYSGLKLTDKAAIYPSEVGSSWAGDAFGRGSVAMALEGGWLLSYLKETFPALPYGLTELPKGPQGRSNFLFTVAYVIPKASPHADAAWKLIQFLTSEEAQAQVTFAMPSRKAVSSRYVKQHPDYAPLLAGAEYARPFAFGPKGDRVKDRLGVAVQEVFLGAKKAPEALKDACTEIDQLTQL